MNFVAVKALAGFNYVRADQVIAIGATEPTKCKVYHDRRRDDPLLGAGQGRDRQTGGRDRGRASEPQAEAK